MSDDFSQGMDEGLDGEASQAGQNGDAFALQRQRAADSGGFFFELDNHVLTYLPGPSDRLVISFDNLAAVREQEDRILWGQKFLGSIGANMLGIQIKRRDWYRDAEFIAALEMLRDEGFFRRFNRISTYGASMGGFAALAFAPVVPGCTVMSFAPQRSLDPALSPYETRYRYARGSTDWTLPYSDAAEGLRAASRVYIAFDPRLEEDRLHAADLAAPNVTFLPMPHLGHKLPPALLKMGLLKKISLGAFDAELELPEFHRLMRSRRDSMPWRVDFLRRAGAAGHPRLALRLAEKMLAEQPHWKLRHIRRELAATVERAGTAA